MDSWEKGMACTGADQNDLEDNGSHEVFEVSHLPALGLTVTVGRLLKL